MNTNPDSIDVAIIGAGPNGLALAANLRSQGVQHRIFGSPMQTWLDLPKDMNLKSLGFATTIPTPGGQTFPEYCRARGLEDYEPIEFQTFAEYGLELQQKFVPHVENTLVTSLEQVQSGFEIALDTGERFHAQRVVMAIGLGYFPRIPAPLDSLPADRVSHTWGYTDFDAFCGKDVVVVGGGSSALETAVVLHERGARARVVARGQAPFGQRGAREWERNLIDRIKVPISSLGHSRENWVLEHIPWLMHFLPAQKRLPYTRQHLGPVSAWWLRDRAEGKFPIQTQTSVIAATLENDKVQLRLRDRDRREHTVEADHVIAGTGYEVNLARIPFLSRRLERQISLWEKMPRLSRHFESSVPGLFFIGPIAAESFGPLVRFVAGTEFTVSVVGPHLARKPGIVRAVLGRTTIVASASGTPSAPGERVAAAAKR